MQPTLDAVGDSALDSAIPEQKVYTRLHVQMRSSSRGGFDSEQQEAPRLALMTPPDRLCSAIELMSCHAFCVSFGAGSGWICVMLQFSDAICIVLCRFLCLVPLLALQELTTLASKIMNHLHHHCMWCLAHYWTRYPRQELVCSPIPSGISAD